MFEFPKIQGHMYCAKRKLWWKHLFFVFFLSYHVPLPNWMKTFKVSFNIQQKMLIYYVCRHVKKERRKKKKKGFTQYKKSLLLISFRSEFKWVCARKYVIGSSFDIWETWSVNGNGKGMLHMPLSHIYHTEIPIYA